MGTVRSHRCHEQRGGQCKESTREFHGRSGWTMVMATKMEGKWKRRLSKIVSTRRYLVVMAQPSEKNSLIPGPSSDRVKDRNGLAAATTSLF
mmetsp:Transcript_18101/g.42736  ORF Transcript_18101/g.42736 Transcript_18101/m.42736 type:complete len:92 (+) Transcript_18101:113-388(+)